jgi:hypothetical protein
MLFDPKLFCALNCKLPLATRHSAFDPIKGRLIDQPLLIADCAVLLLSIADPEALWASALCLRSGLRQEFLRASLESGAILHTLEVLKSLVGEPAGSNAACSLHSSSDVSPECRACLAGSQAAHYITAFLHGGELGQLLIRQGAEAQLPTLPALTMVMSTVLARSPHPDATPPELRLSLACFRGVEACSRIAASSLEDPEVLGRPDLRQEMIETLEASMRAALSRLEHPSDLTGAACASGILKALLDTKFGRSMCVHAFCSSSWGARSRPSREACPLTWFKMITCMPGTVLHL